MRLASIARYWYDVPWAVPGWGRAELVATLRCILTGRIVDGGLSERFARTIRERLGVAYAIPVNRGRTAIELGLRAMGIGDGDDVVVPSYICRSVMDGVVRAGARPVFADVGPDLQVTVDTVRHAITPATRCVIVAHLFGGAAPIDAIERLLDGTGIALMDDAAQALGARRGDRPVGTFGACGIIGCGPGKPLSGVAGACLVTNDAALHARAVAIRLEREPAGLVARRTISFWLWRRWRGITLPIRVAVDRLFGEGDEPDPISAHLANLDAAIALEQLRTLDQRVAERRDNARRLLLAMPELRNGATLDADRSLVLKWIVVLPPAGPDLADAVAILGALGLECQRGYEPCHTSAMRPAVSLPFTEQVWSRVLCVPVDSAWRRRPRKDTGWPFGPAAVPARDDVAADGVRPSRLEPHRSMATPDPRTGGEGGR